jgi:Transposase
MDISRATFFRWKQLYGGLMPSQVKKLRQFEEENMRLRKMVDGHEMLDRICPGSGTRERGFRTLDLVIEQDREHSFRTQQIFD